MTIEPYMEDVETFCSKKRGQVLISLRTLGQPKGNTLTGVPVSCNFEVGCLDIFGVLCLLKAKQITTGRKRR